jgi:hypothetical protein
MKKYASLFLALVHMFTFSSFAQHVAPTLAPANKGTASPLYYALMREKLDSIIAYHVEEKINMQFGGTTTTYTVTDASLINTNDLGPQNKRIVTPKYGKPKAKAITILPTASLTTYENEPVALPPTSPFAIKTKERYAMINLLDTYERMLEKGFKTVEMLKNVGDKHFFDGDLVIAAKWYTQVFDMTTALEPEYYYRYAVSLASICQDEKANIMMQCYEELNLRQ